jgi:hypothetical protein
MQNFAELHLKPETPARYGLLNNAYPVPAATLKSTLLEKEELLLAMKLHGLQPDSRNGETEPAMERLE